MDFKGGGGSGGGGFNGNSSQDQEKQGRARRSYDEQTVIPVTIRMVLRAQPDPSGGGDGSVVLEDGRKLASVKIVGAARSVNDHSTNVVYELEDGTGLIEVKQWLDDNDCTALQEMRAQTLKEHIYLKVVGQVKDYDGKKIIVANSVRPLTTGNEISHHFLEVVHSGEYHKKMDSIVGPAATTSINDGIGFGGQAVAQQSNNSSGDDLKDAVLNLFKNADSSSETGVHVQDCINELSGKYSEADIRSMVENLSEEGHVYSTISDDHFKFAH